MTTPRKDAEFQGPRILLRGMVRNTLMPADSPNLCAQPANRDAFDAIIDARFSGHRSETDRHLVTVRLAKAICRRCPVRESCLTVHGPDLELGVVAGATDEERAALFGEVTA